MKTIRMSEREKDLTAASDLGKHAFLTNRPYFMRGFLTDDGLRQAWDNGYRISKEKHAAWEPLFLRLGD